MDFLFHLAGSSNPAASNVNPAGDVVETLIPSLRLLEACREAGAGRIVYASSGGTIYGAAAREAVTERHPTEPITAYGINKLAVEKYLALYRRLHGLDSIVLRISNPYGPFQERGRGQGAVGAFMWKALLGEPIEIFGDGSVVRDYIYVDDVAAAFLAVASYEGPERLFNVGSGEGRTLTQVAHDVQAASGRHGIEIQYKAGRPADVPFNILDASLLRQATSWSPNTGWQEGLAATAGWISRHLDGGR
jgi:UDP-glucose 4-epimerase